VSPGIPTLPINETENFRTSNPTASPATAATIDEGRLWSQAERNSGVLFYRDGGMSSQFLFQPSEASLWLFGDSPISDGAVVFGSTAAISTANPQDFSANASGQSGAEVTEVPTGRSCADGSCQFLTNPTDLSCPQLRGEVRWPTGVAHEPGPSTRVVITFVDVCTETSTVEGSGLLEYDPAGNRITSGQVRPFVSSPISSQLPPPMELGSPLFYKNDGFVYFLSSECDSTEFGGCTSGKLFVSRVLDSARAWRDASSYQWWTGQAWADTPALATSVLPTVRGLGPFGIGVGDFSRVANAPATFALIVMTDIDGGFEVLESNSPTGPWEPALAGRVPDNCAAPPGNTLTCRTLELHPELSTATRLVFSWFSVDDYDASGPNDAIGGHLRLGVIPW
jgi:hypothetical protein